MKLALYPHASPAFIGGYMAALFGESADSNPFPRQKDVEDADSHWHWETGHKQGLADITNNATLIIGAIPAGQIVLQVLVPEVGWRDAFTAHYPNWHGAVIEDYLKKVRRVGQVLTKEFGEHVRIVQRLIKVLE